MQLKKLRFKPGPYSWLRICALPYLKLKLFFLSFDSFLLFFSETLPINFAPNVARHTVCQGFSFESRKYILHATWFSVSSGNYPGISLTFFFSFHMTALVSAIYRITNIFHEHLR